MWCYAARGECVLSIMWCTCYTFNAINTGETFRTFCSTSITAWRYYTACDFTRRHQFFSLLGGTALLLLSAFFAAGGWDLIPEEELAEALQQIPWASTFTSVQFFTLTTTFLAGIGVVLLIVAILGFIMTWGLWSGKGWARIITMILAVIGVVTGIFNLPGSLISILIDIVILYYLTRPHIKAYYQ